MTRPELVFLHIPEMPQYRYLAWANSYNRLYRLDEMAALLEVIKACYAWDLRLYYNRAADKDNEPEVAGV